MQTKKNFTLLFSLFIFGLITLLPLLSLAADLPKLSGTYKPIVGIPGVDTDTVGNGFSSYINAIYLLSISIAALLAVLKIIFAGATYMLTDLVGSKEKAKKDIRGALFGLLLILGVVLILNVINPNLTDMKDINPPSINLDNRELFTEQFKLYKENQALRSVKLCESSPTCDSRTDIKEEDCRLKFKGQYISGWVWGGYCNYNPYNITDDLIACSNTSDRVWTGTECVLKSSTPGGDGVDGYKIYNQYTDTGEDDTYLKAKTDLESNGFEPAPDGDSSPSNLLLSEEDIERAIDRCQDNIIALKRYTQANFLIVDESVTEDAPMRKLYCYGK